MTNPPSQMAAFWDDLKALIRSVVDEMNQSAELSSKTGGLECQFEHSEQVFIRKESLPRMYVTVHLRPASIDVGRRMVFNGAGSMEQSWESLPVKIDGSVLMLRNKAGETLTVDQAVYYILRPFLHLDTLLH